MLKFFKQRFQFHYYPQARPNQASQCVYQRPCEAQGCGTSEDMPSVPEHLPLSDCPLSYSGEQLTPRSENTVLSLAHNDTLWTLQPAPGNCEYYWQAILLMTSGGSVLICGMVLSGLYFGGFNVMATNILGPALLSVGLMVLVVGMVLMPVTRQMRHQSAMKRLCSYYKPHINLWGQCEGIVHPKIKLLSSFIHPPLVPNLFHTGRWINDDRSYFFWVNYPLKARHYKQNTVVFFMQWSILWFWAILHP